MSSSELRLHWAKVPCDISGCGGGRLTPVLKTIFHQCVISYNCSQSNSDGSVLKPSGLDSGYNYMI